MTLPDERYRAVRQTRQFLWELCDPKATPSVPAVIRSQARHLLRHYPSDYDMHQACELAPSVFQTEMEPVSKLFAQYEQNKSKD